MKRKTTLVLPPDDRIGIDSYFGANFSYRYGNQSHMVRVVDFTMQEFPLICIGLWDIKIRSLLVNSPAWNNASRMMSSWYELASGELKLADVKFRTCTKRERKEL